MTSDERRPQLESKACGNIIKCAVIKICRSLLAIFFPHLFKELEVIMVVVCFNHLT